MGVANTHVEQFTADVAGIVTGTILRAATSNGRVRLAQADTPGNITGVVAIARHATAQNGVVSGNIDGEAEVLLVTGLSPVVGDSVYVSPATAGRGTTVNPGANVSLVGVITNTSKYASRSTVRVVLALANAATASIADWAEANTRYFFIHPTLGNDANIGYIDAATGSTFTYAQGLAVALRTVEEFSNRIPKNGNDRILVCFVYSDAAAVAQTTLYQKDGVTPAILDLVGIVPYSYQGFIFRAGDFTNSTNDRTDVGCINALTGPNADGSWTVQSYASPAITNAAGALPTGSELCTLSVRFKGNISAGLRARRQNCKWGRTTTQLEVGSPSVTAGAFPAANDEYFIEKPGLIMGGIAGSMSIVSGKRLTTVTWSMTVCGFDFLLSASTRFMRIDAAQLKACRLDTVTNGAIVNCSTYWNLQTVYKDESDTSRAISANIGFFASAGAGVDSIMEGGSTDGLGTSNQIIGVGSVQRISARNMRMGTLFASSAIFNRLVFLGLQGGQRMISIGRIGGQSVTTRLLCRSTVAAAGLEFQESNGAVEWIEFGGGVMTNGIVCFGLCGLAMRNLSTTGGITGAGVNVTQAWLGNFEVETGAAIPTLTGAAGDYLDNTGAVTWAGIVALRTDPSGNRIMPHATQP